MEPQTATGIAERTRHRSLDKHRSQEVTREWIDANLREAVQMGFCPLCPGVYYWAQLHSHISVHGCEDWKGFLRKIGLPADVRAVSDAKRKHASDSKAQFYASEAGELTKKRIADLNRGTVHRDRRSVSHWELAKHVCRGGTAQSLMREIPHAGQIARKLGLGVGTSFVSFWSQPFKFVTLRRVRATCGFDAKTFADRIGLDVKQLSHGETIIADPSSAKPATDWIMGTAKTLLSQPSLTIGHQKFRRDAVAKTLLPECEEINEILLKTIGDIRHNLRRESEWSVEQFGESLCDHAQSEQKWRSQSDAWRRTLRFFAESDDAEKWLGENLGRLRGDKESDGFLVREAIAARLGTTPAIVQSAMRDRTNTISPEMMSSLILKYCTEHQAGAKVAATQQTPPKSDRTERGHRKGWRAERTKQKIRVAAALSCFGLNPWNIAPIACDGRREPTNAAFDRYRKMASRNKTLMQRELAGMNSKSAQKILRSPDK